MPSPSAIESMYGQAYLFSNTPEGTAARAEDSPPPDPLILRFLQDAPPGRFIDYGCGRGNMLLLAAAHRWDARGVEFDAGACARVRGELGLPVLTVSESKAWRGTAAAVHVGDVLEHLCDPARTFREDILPLLAPNGSLLVQGPLREFNLFGLLLDLKAALAAARASIPPYHVILPSPAGQRAFFDTLGLRERAFRVFETAWPSPSRLTSETLTLRNLGLLGVRLASQAASGLSSQRLGNRFAYIGSFEDAPPQRTGFVREA